MVRTYHTFDLIIIGAGSAGISALKEARKYTDNVLLVNDGAVETTCIKTGCMPSKSLIHSANLYNSRKIMPDAGIIGSKNLSPDIPAIMEIVRAKRDHFSKYMSEEVDNLKDFIVKGKARYNSPTTIRIDNKLFHTKASIIATGSKPFIPPKYLDYKQHIISSDNLFERKDLPKRMAVIGMGAIGLEIAQALAKLDIEITIINKNDKVGVVKDSKINDIILQSLAEDMKIWLNSDPDIEQCKEGLILRSDKKEVIVDAIFIAAGRKPNIFNLGLKKIGLDTDGRGIPHFNRYTMQIPDYPIYIAGDANDERAILHESNDEGRRAAYHALNGKAGYLPRYAQIHIIFTKPVIAIVGDMSCIKRNCKIIAGEADFENQGRAYLEDKNFGKIRLFAEEKGGYFKGAEIMAPAAEHLAHFLAQSITNNLTVKQILKTPFYHPTLEEGMKTALQIVDKKVQYD